MRHELILSPQAVRDSRAFPAHLRAELRDRLEEHLRREPTRLSRSRVKSSRGLGRPQYRLRIGDIRVFYDVEGAEVHVLTIITKELAERWLESHGVAE